LQESERVVGGRGGDAECKRSSVGIDRTGPPTRGGS
jgi:hypothetical protein